ncbi:alpha-L-fucosidase [Gimesia aquarii]|uniref:alpha-L-fucosidase n=1 Tax=Gimesia aquarii TaxID=2527964 RepID=A0A517WYH1_9PLAN|nr:alpha-L-fucosidase [Gimesia aquarii]QDU10294.1 Alpha-L-fucosidase [Gimesia aquarii]
MPSSWVIQVLILSSLIGLASSEANAHDKQQPILSESVLLEKIKAIAHKGPFQPDWNSLEKYKIPMWYQDAKFGIFIHWGAYSVPAFGSEWYPRWMYIDKKTWRGNTYAHHAKTYGLHKDFGYKNFIPLLTGDNFNAAQWVKLFKDAGARYVVPVAEHHDGFAMYDSNLTRWNAVDMGPKRDIIGLLEKETRKAGLKFGVSSHRAFNWAYFPRKPHFDNVNPHYFDLYGRDHEFLYADDVYDLSKPWPPQDMAFKNHWLARTGELVEKYHPDLIWFDFGISPIWVKSYDTNPFQKHLKKFAAYYYNDAAKNHQEVVLNYKLNAFPESAAVLDIERGKLAGIRPLLWQTDTSVSFNSWGHIRDQHYKPVNLIVDDLVDIVSKNGVLLLNVCPKPDGSIPQMEQNMLRKIGEWLKMNGEAIYETRPWLTYGEGPSVTIEGEKQEEKNKGFTAQDIRFTTRGDTLYAIILGWPEERQVLIKSLAKNDNGTLKKVRRIKLLGSEDSVKWKQTSTSLKVTLPEKSPCDFAVVLKIE